MNEALTTETFGNVLVVHTPDELTEDTAENVLDVARAAVEDGRADVVLQMNRTESYDSAGLTALVDLQDDVRAAGGTVAVCGLEDPGRTIFQLVRFDQRFDVFDSIVDAVGSLQ